MDTREQIQLLSFGRALPNMESCLGLHLSQDVMFLTEVRIEGGKPKVMHLLRLPVPGGGSAKVTKTLGTLNTDFLSDHEKIFEVLKKAIAEVNWKSKFIMVSLSHQFGILRYFTLPPIDRRFWRSAVPVEAKKYIPIPFSSLVHDYQVNLQTGSDKKRKLGALFGVTHKKNVESLKELTKKLGLTLVGVELAPCSVERLWDTLTPNPAQDSYAQVHFDGGHIRILIADGGVPIFFRDVFLADGATVDDRRKIDLNGCIGFTRKQLGSRPPKVIRISGQMESRDSWVEAFHQDVGQAVEFQDTDALLGLRGGQWGGHAAIGAALRHISKTTLIVDLSETGKISDEDYRTAVLLLKTAGAAAALFLTLGLFRMGMLGMEKSNLNRTKIHDPEVAAAFEGRSQEEIEQMMEEMRQKVAAFGAIAKGDVPLTHLFAGLADTVPDSAWITSLEYINPLSSEGRNRKARTLTIKGGVSDKSRAIEQDVAYRFAESLEEDPRFKKAFPEIDPQVTGPRETAEEDDGVKAAPTVFTMACASFKVKAR